MAVPNKKSKIPVEFISGEVGGQGKSTFSCLRLDYRTLNNETPFLFDADLGQLNSLNQNASYPHKRKLKFSEDSKQQVFADGLIEVVVENNPSSIIVDLPASSMEALSTYDSYMELFASAESLGVVFVMFFVLASDQQKHLFKESVNRYPDARHVLVQNTIGTDSDFQDFEDPAYKAWLKAEDIPVIRIPNMTSDVLAFARENGIRLCEATKHPGVPIGHRQRIHVFNRRVYGQFDQIEYDLYPWLKPEPNVKGTNTEGNRDK